MIEVEDYSFFIQKKWEWKLDFAKGIKQRLIKAKKKMYYGRLGKNLCHKIYINIK